MRPPAYAVLCFNPHPISDDLWADAAGRSFHLDSIAMGTLLVLSDVHRSGAREQERRGFDSRAVSSPLLRTFQRVYRRHVWLDDAMAHNHLLGAILRRVPDPQFVVANGDFTLDTAFVGVSDDPAFESAAEALGELRAAYGSRLRCTIGDHDLGKKSFVGGAGGVRRRSLERCESDLGLPRFWYADFPGWRWIGMTSTLAAWPVFRPETLPEEIGWWESAHARHLAEIDSLFTDANAAGLQTVLFCHDPTALPFLRQLPGVRAALPRIGATVIGHLHTRLVLRMARLLAGIPRVEWAGHSIRRYTAALNQARCWREFRVTLCPSPTGIELLKDGGFLTSEWPPLRGIVQFQAHRLPWSFEAP
jgi:hypothetical protein